MSFSRARSGQGGHPPKQPTASAVPRGWPPNLPKLKIDEMVEDMAIFGLPITRDDFRKPTQEGVRAIFAFFIARITGKTEDDMRQPAFGCLDELANPELHDDSIPQLHFFRECQSLFEAAQYFEFGLRDLTSPEPARLVWQMSALINFGKFYEERVRQLLPMMEEGEAVRERVEELVQQEAGLDAEIAGLHAKREAESEQVAKEQTVVDEKNAELQRLMGERMAITEETKQLKADLQTTTDTISNLKFREMAMSQEADALRVSVVSSPDRVKAEIAESRDRLEDETESLGATVQRIRTLRERLDWTIKMARDITTANRLISESQAEREKVIGMERLVKEHTNKMRELEMEQKEIESTSSHLERQIQSAEHRLVRVRQQRDGIEEEEHAVDAQLIETARKIDREIDGIKEEIVENQRRQNELARQMQQVVSDFEGELAGVGKKLAAVDKRLNLHCKHASETNEEIETENRQALRELGNVINKSSALVQ